MSISLNLSHLSVYGPARSSPFPDLCLEGVQETTRLNMSQETFSADVPTGMVASILGKPLNKAQQCSAWQERPFSQDQLLYAANDAAVLLALFDAFVAVAPPEKFCVVRHGLLEQPETCCSHMAPQDQLNSEGTLCDSLIYTPYPVDAGARVTIAAQGLPGHGICQGS